MPLVDALRDNSLTPFRFPYIYQEKNRPNVPERHGFAGTPVAAVTAIEAGRMFSALTWRSIEMKAPETKTLGVAGRIASRAWATAFAALALITMTSGAFAQGPRVTDTITSSCVFAYGTASCVRQFRYNDPGNSGIKQYAEPSAEDAADARERERAWEARCRPALRQDVYGVSRYVYAAPGCEYGRMH